MVKVVVIASVFAIAALIGIQFLPYGHNHSNPPVQAEPQWDSPQTRELAVRACFDCHSNETEWPWYSTLAPVSWLIQRDVENGRKELNFSEWNRPQREARESPEQVQKGKMPQWYYTVLHPTANLSPQEKQLLIKGLETSVSKR